MSPDPKQLARFAHVEPPPSLDAWVRPRLQAAVAERAGCTPNHAAGPWRAEGTAASVARARAARAPASMPLVERLALAVGIVACSVQASGFVLRFVWSALTLGH